MTPRLRLVKVIVHPIYVVDDGDHLTEFQNGPSVIAAKDWPDFPERLERDMVEAEHALNAEPEPFSAAWYELHPEQRG